MMVCSSPADCAEIEARHATGNGLLIDGGASRGNLLSGEADAAILTVSRTDDERGANPGYRAFLANGFNVTRALVLFVWEVIIEITAALRAARRDVRPRGHRGGIYPLMRGAMCVVVRDLVVFSVLTDMMRGRPAVYATFASYDEVAHHSGLDARRHARGPAQARPAVRPHRAGASLRAAPVRDRGALRPRPDPGRDLQAAPRVRARRARRALGIRGAGRGVAGRRRAAGDGRPRRRGGHRTQVGEARPRTTSRIATWSCSAPATSASST